MAVYYSLENKRKNFLNNFSVTVWLIIINVVFFITSTFFLFVDPNYINYIALNPLKIIQGKYLWTFLTSMFMHGGILHLFVNMFVLFSLGSFCEKIIGRKRFLLFYLVSGIVAGLFFVFLSAFFGNTVLGQNIFGNPSISAVGASGAIFAIAGLFVVLTPRLRFSIIFLPFFSLPAYIMIPLVLFGVWVITASTGSQIIGNTAHFGGLVVGLIYGFYLKRKFPRKTQMLSRRFR